MQRELKETRPPLRAYPRVSILVAAWNEANMIARHIESVVGLEYPNKEYIVCAGGADETFEIAQRYAGPGVLVLEQAPGEGKQRALRKAFQRSTGSIVYLTDADCIVNDVSFERVLAPLINEAEPAATGGSIPPVEQRRTCGFVAYQWGIQLYALAHAPAYGDGLLGRNAAVCRDVLEVCGAFDEAVPTGTDYHLAKALRGHGYRIRNVPASMAKTSYASGWRQYARQQRRWLRNVALLGARAGAWNEVRASVQTSVVGVVMLLGVTTVFTSHLLFALLAPGMLQSVAAKIRYMRFGSLLDGQRVANPLRTFAAALSYTVGEFVVWALPLIDYPFEGRRRQW